MSKVNVSSVSRAIIMKCHLENKTMTNDEIAEVVVKIFEKGGVTVKTTGSCIAWYKSKMRKEGKLVGQSSKKSIEFNVDEFDFDEKKEEEETNEE